MNLLDIWAITTIVNFYYRAKMNIQTYKAYADLGYIFNNKRLRFIEDEKSKDDDLFDWFLYKFGKYIPIYNFYQSLIRKFDYCIDAQNNIKEFEKYQIIEKMTAKEIEEYNKKKTGIHALRIRRKLNRKRKKYDMVVLSDGSSILYDYKYNNIEKGEELFNNIKIIEARGNLENTKEEELTKIVYGSHITIGLGILNTYDNPDKLLNNYSENDKVELVLEENNIDTEEKEIINTVKKKVRKK